MISTKNRASDTGFPGITTIAVIGAWMAVVFLAYLLTAAHGLTWAHGGADGGELTTASVLGGVAHPPGYGLYTLIGGFWTYLPGVSPDQGMVWFSLASALACCALVGAAVWSLLPDRSPADRGAAALTAGGVLAFSQAFWSQAVIVEVYAFMALGFAALLLLAVQRTPTLWSAALFGHVFGLALTHHLTALIWLPGLLLLAPGWTPRRVLAALLGFLTGLYPYLILLLRAGHVPAADWGGITSGGFPAFIDHISGAIYRVYLQPITPAALFGGIVDWLAHLPGDFAVAALLLALMGVTAGVRAKRWRLIAAAVIWCVGIAAFTGLYRAEDTSIPYRLPLSIVLAVFAGLGILAVRGRLRAVVGAAAIALLLLGNWNAVDVSRDHAPDAFISETGASFPDRAILITGTSETTFTLWYAQHAAGQGNGWILIDRNLWQFDWYRDDLTRVYPGLPAPAESLESWLRDPAFDGVVIASDAFLSPPPHRRSAREGVWYVLEAR